MDSRSLDGNTQIQEVIERALYRINTCIPGTVKSFDAETQTVSVVPAVKMRLVIEGEEVLLELPKIINAPLVFPFATTAGFALTLPVQSGDSCLILFSQRSIDNWHKLGGSQPPEDAVGSRHHDLSDALVLLAPSPLTSVLGSWEASGIELRNRAKNSRVTVTDDDVTLEYGDGSVTLSEDEVTVAVGTTVVKTAPTSIELDGLGTGATEGVVQGECICTFSGAPHPMVSQTVKASL